MTFSAFTKTEILKNVHNLPDCCADVFLYAVFKTLGSLTLENKCAALDVSSENGDLVKLCAALVKRRFGKTAEVRAISGSTFRSGAVYGVTFDLSVMQKLGLIYYDADGLMEISQGAVSERLQKDCCRKAFVKALFLSCGSVTVPAVSDDLKESKRNQRYHLELVFSDEKFAEEAQTLFGNSGFKFRITRRKNSTVLYIKGSEEIADMLVYLGAVSAKLKLENVIIERGIRNAANRQSNCIAANIDKSVAASNRQTEAIAALEKSGKLQLLSEELQSVAKLRKDNPLATLDELAQMANLTKSGVRHRLKRLETLAYTQDDEE
ncbi:MAG: DNA-binding protein WhiA [Corallococcus sp.]|nr:DNA-binding protein WhiA [Corallococcus sp.]